MEEISIVYGDKREYLLQLVDEDQQPAVLTSLIFTAKQRPYDSEPVFTKTTESDEFSIPGSPVGDAFLTITPEDLEGIANHWHTLVWDCRHVDGDGDPVTPLRGVLRVRPSISETADSS